MGLHLHQQSGDSPCRISNPGARHQHRPHTALVKFAGSMRWARHQQCPRFASVDHLHWIEQLSNSNHADLGRNSVASRVRTVPTRLSCSILLRPVKFYANPETTFLAQSVRDTNEHVHLDVPESNPVCFCIRIAKQQEKKKEAAHRPGSSSKKENVQASPAPQNSKRDKSVCWTCRIRLERGVHADQKKLIQKESRIA